jgi:hypothetical protein
MRFPLLQRTPRAAPRRSKSRSRIAAFSLLLVALSAPSSVAWAQNAQDRESARQLLDRGDEQVEQGDLAGALASYRAAHELMHVPTTGLEVARISAKLGKLVEARDVALEVIRMPAAAREAKPFKVARAAAEDLARELATQIPTLRLELTPEAAADQASLEIDERSVPPAALGLGYALNPGRHRVQIAATGYLPVAQDITLRPGETKTLRVKLVLAPKAKVQRPPPPEASPAPPPERSSTWPQWVGFSLGGAGLVAGTVAGILSLNRTRAAKEHCTGNLCTPEAEHDLNAAMTMANISNAGFGVAVLGASIGLTSYLLSGNTPQSTGTTLHFAAGPGVATVRLQGTLW